jgi:RHS repeat-associated protein
MSDVTNSYVWNAESEIKTAGGLNYSYDGDGDRVQKSNGKIYWFGAGSQVLDESDTSGNITDEYIYFGSKRIADRVVSSDSYFFYAEDMLGSSRAMANSAGALCFDADFFPYGGEHDYTNTCPQNYKFTGKERDPETNNDDFDARYYSSAYGRFLSADWSSTPSPVPYANLTNPQTLNLYAMVSDNPESFADLDGHKLGEQSNTAACTVGGSESCEAQQAAAQNNGTAQNQQPNVNLDLGGKTVVGTFVAGDFSDGSKGALIDVVAQNCDNCRWAQTVTRTGDNPSNEHTDRELGKAQPLYPPGHNGPGTDRQNFSDTPSTHPGGSGSFNAVTTLGVADVNNKTFKVIGSMTYGYTVSKNGTVTESKPRVATRSEAKSSIAVLKRESPAWKIGP